MGGGVTPVGGEISQCHNKPEEPWGSGPEGCQPEGLEINRVGSKSVGKKDELNPEDKRRSSNQEKS